jgi:glycosyltransferase involved in cell wall biosynthesis
MSGFGFKSFLIVPKKERIQIKNIKVYEIGKAFSEAFSSRSLIKKTILEILTSLSVSFKVYNLFKKIKPSIVISYFYPFLLPFIRFFSFVSGYKIKIICKLDWDGTIEGNAFKKIFKKIGLFVVYLFSDLVVIESPNARKRALTFAKFLTPKLKAIPNGISSEFVRSVQKNGRRKKIILCVASIIRTKGLDLLLDAFSQLKSKYPEYKLRIVGPIVDKGYYKELVIKSSELNISKRVYFLGEISDEKLIQEYRNAEIFCLPSFLESFSISRIEALVSGLPVITTDTGAYELLGNAGIVVNRGDVKSLTEALDRVMGNEELRKRMSITARKIGKKYT